MTTKRVQRIAVIGAGLGGLSAAISLAQDGHTVDVYEKNDKVGGKLNIHKAEGFSFDLGPSILTLPHIFERTFACSGKRMADYVTIEPVTPHWRNFFEDGTTFDLHPDPAVMAQELAKLGPNLTAPYAAFMAYARGLYDRADTGYFNKGLDTLWQVVREYGVMQSLRGFDAFRTMDGAIESYIREPHLRETLDYFAKYVGSSPYRAPAVLNLMAYAQSAYGLWYVRGGMYGLAQGLERLAGEVGVTIHLNTEVTRMVQTGRAVTALELATGAIVQADQFVSDMEVVPAYERLLGESRSFLQRFDRFEPACSGLVLHLGVKKLYPALAHHNFFYSADPRQHFARIFDKKELPVDPTIYLVAPCKSDRTIAPAGCEIIKVLPHIPHLRDTDPPTMQDYLRLRGIVLDKLERMGLAGLRENIVYEMMWTPRDIQQRYYSHKGAIYGVVSDLKKNRGFKAPKKSDAYDNLYFVGGSVNPGAGMPMVFLSGQQVAAKIAAELTAV